MRLRLLLICCSPLIVIGCGPALAQEGSELSSQLSNPLAALISVPIQANYNDGIGPAEDGEQYLINIQPVIPVTLNDDWNLISRTIVPVVSQIDIYPGAGDQTGLGNATQSLFISSTVNNPIFTH